MKLPRRLAPSAAVLALASSAIVSLAQGMTAPIAPVPHTKQIDPAAQNVLMASDSSAHGDLKEVWPGQAARFWVAGWTQKDDSFTWTVNLPEAGDYAPTLLVVNCGHVLIDCKLTAPGPVPIELAGPANKLAYTVAHRESSMTNEWQRDPIPGTLHLPAGESKITLHALPGPTQGDAKPFNLAVYSLELAKPSVVALQAKQAAALRSSTQWMADTKYGLMFTWTSVTMPQHGPQKSYEQAVDDFDVDKFADMVAGTGAGFIAFATSWSTYYFPAPLKTWARVAPGQTTKRDLIAELADALNKRGIKLMIYYHVGRTDKDFWTGTGVRAMDKPAYFKEWEDTIREIGLRYGSKLAGWWFDDGTTFYYPLQAPWKQLTEAAKAGNPARVIGYNSWILPKTTEFQDFACGEGGFPDRLVNEDELPIGGSGIYLSGPQKGLQATVTLPNEGGNWGHIPADTPIPPPNSSTPEMIAYFQKAVARRLVPIVNLELYQDGTPSPATVEEFKAIKAAIKPAP
jgi:hypothetical protein